MYREIVRPMSGDERKLLEDRIACRAAPVGWRESLKWLTVWSAGLTFCALCVVGACLLIPDGVARGGWRLAGVIACGFVIAIFGLAGLICFYVMTQILHSHFEINRLQKEYRQETAPVIGDALADGRMKVKQVTTTAVIELTEFEDEGSGWLFDVGGGHVFFLKGQSYTPEDESSPWPNSDFEIVRTCRQIVFRTCVQRAGFAASTAGRAPHSESANSGKAVPL